MVLGNGRLGAMVSGGMVEENIWLNDDTLWPGENTQSTSATALATFPKIRQLLLDRDEPAANALYPNLFAPYNQTYLPLGNLRLSLPAAASQVRNYQRRLDLATGIATVTYNLEGVTYTREMFVSYPCRHSAHCIINSAATCWSVPRAPVRSQPTCRAFGMTGPRRVGRLTGP